MRTIVIQAISFCYGPASIGLALARELRRQSPGPSLRLIALGEATSLELFSSAAIFDKVLEFRLSDLENPAHPATALVRAAEMVVTVADFEFAQCVRKLGRRKLAQLDGGKQLAQRFAKRDCISADHRSTSEVESLTTPVHRKPWPVSISASRSYSP